MLVRRGAHAALNRPCLRRVFRPVVEVLETRVVPSNINYLSGFTAHSALTANGTATITGSAAQLTDGNLGEAGSFFTNSTFDITQFTTSFTFDLSKSTTNSTLADGLTFTIQASPSGPAALGANGEGLGYEGIPNSVAIKFDLYNNAGEGDNSTGIFTDGRDPTVGQSGLGSQFPDMSVSMDGSGVSLQNNDPMQVTLSYNGSTLTESVQDTVTGATFTQTYSVNIASIIGSNTAYLGFTGSTGGLGTSVQNIQTWTGTFGATDSDAPTLTSMSPQSAREGSTDLPLALIGTNFTTDSTAQWNGTALATTFLTSSQLTALVPASLLTEEGTASITVFNPDSNSTSNALTFTIAGAPLTGITLTGLNISSTEGQSFSGVVGTFTDTTPNTTPANYSALLSWGDGQQSTGTVQFNGSGGFVILGSHTYAEEGSYPLQVFVQSTSGATATANSTAQVADAPLSATGTTINLSQGTTFTGVVATFTDANPNAPLSDFTATITWGNGNISTGTVTALGGGNFSVSGTNTYAQSGTFGVNVAIADVGGSTANATTTVNVGGTSPAITLTPLSINSTEGQGFSGVVATFTDTTPNTTPANYSVLLSWGDGQQSTGTVQFNGSGSFVILGTHTYAEEGSYPLQIFVQSTSGATATANSTAQVADAPLSATGTTINLSQGTTFTGVVATFTDANPNAPLSDFTATITWGNGNISTGTVTALGSGNFSVSGTNTYAQSGTFGVNVAIADVGGSTANATTTVNVGGTSPAITLTPLSINSTEGQGFSGVVATFTDTTPNTTPANYSVLLSWGDGQQSSGTVQFNGSGSFVILGTHTYAEEGSYPLQIFVQSTSGVQATGQSMAQVADAPLSATVVAINPTLGIPFSGVVATFSDANTNAPVSDFTATITWGNGNITTGTITPLGGGNFSVSGTNTYSQAGFYTLNVAIADVGGSSANASTTINLSGSSQSITLTALGISTTEGQNFSGVVATFTDTNPNATPASYTQVLITWGDGQQSTGTVQLNPSGGFAVLGNHTYAEEGSYPLQVFVQSITGANATGQSTAQVADAPLFASGTTLNLSLGTAFTGVVANFTDANPNAPLSDFTATITWGNGNVTTGTITQNGNGSFSVSGSNTYQTAATYSIVVVITDQGGSTATATTTAKVGSSGIGDQPLTATGVNITATAGMAQDFMVAEFTDADPSAQTGTYAVPINWGDGTALAPGRVTQPGGQGTPFFVDATHTYNEAGTFTVQVQIFDEAGAYAATSSTATVVSGGGAARSSPGANTLGRPLAAPAEALLLDAEPALIQKGTQQGPEQQFPKEALGQSGGTESAALLSHLSTSVQSDRPGHVDDTYWATLHQQRGDPNGDLNGWSALELARALGGTVSF